MVAVVLGWLQGGSPRAQPASEVDWSDSATPWASIKAAVGPDGTSKMPHVVFSYFKLDGNPNLNGVSVSAPSGTVPNLWTRHEIAAGLTKPAMASAVANGGHLHIGYNRSSSIAWIDWDTVGELEVNAATGIDILVDATPVRVALDAQLSPVLMFHSGLPPQTYVSKVLPTNPRTIQPGVLANTCQGTSATFAIDANNWRHIACLDGLPEQVHVVSADANMQNQSTVAVFAAQTGLGESWIAPTIVRDASGDLHVAAINRTQNKIWYQCWRTSTQAWLPNAVLVEDDLGLVANAVSLDLSVHPLGPAMGIGVAWQRLHDIHYREANGAVGSPFAKYARLDDSGLVPSHLAGAGTPCTSYARPVKIELQDDDTIWADWTTGDLASAGRSPVMINRFRGWNRSNAWTVTNSNPTPTGLHNVASMDLDSSGSPWTCFFAPDPTNSSKVNLLVRYQAGTPSIVAADVGWPSDSYARGCDIATSPVSQRIGLVFAHTNAGRLRYLEASNSAAPFAQLGGDIVHGGDGNQAAAHLALVIGTDDSPRVAYSPNVGGVVLRYGQYSRTANTWNTQVPVAGTQIGTYLDIAVNPADGQSPMISYFGTPGGAAGKAWFVQRSGILWSVPEAVSPANAGWDTRLASRIVNGSPSTWMTYTNYGDHSIGFALRLSAFNAWVYATVPDTPGASTTDDLPSVAVDAFGYPMLAWRYQRTAGGTLERFVHATRWSRWGGGRARPNPPVGKHDICRRDTAWSGPSFVRDAFDNWRIYFRTSVQQYYSRP